MTVTRRSDNVEKYCQGGYVFVDVTLFVC